MKHLFVAILIVTVLGTGILFSATRKKVHPATAFYAKQDAVFEQKKKELVESGRMPIDIGFIESKIGQYGWHTASESEVGTTPSLSLLIKSGLSSGDSNSGAFGAYSFYQPAFDQAKRSWWIHGVMKKGSDLLVAVNRNAEFQRMCRSKSWDSDGHYEEDCDPPMNSPVGYSVGYLYNGPVNAKVVEVVNSNTLRLDKKSPGDVLQFDVLIAPPDYEDMCACTTSSRGDWNQ